MTIASVPISPFEGFGIKIVEQIIVELFSDEPNRETIVRPNCGRVLNRRDIHERTVETMIGEITLRRPYFYCKNCKKGFHPLDDALIISGTVKQWEGKGKESEM